MQKIRGTGLNCKNCRFWGKTKYDTWHDDGNIRTCHMIEDNSQSMIIIGADDDYGLNCVTHEDFSCILFEQK